MTNREYIIQRMNERERASRTPPISLRIRKWASITLRQLARAGDCLALTPSRQSPALSFATTVIELAFYAAVLAALVICLEGLGG